MASIQTASRAQLTRTGCPATPSIRIPDRPNTPPPQVPHADDRASLEFDGANVVFADVRSTPAWRHRGRAPDRNSPGQAQRRIRPALFIAAAIPRRPTARMPDRAR